MTKSKWLKNTSKVFWSSPKKILFSNLSCNKCRIYILTFFIFLSTYKLVPDDLTMENFVNSLPLKLEELKSHPHSKSGLIIVMGNEACGKSWRRIPTCSCWSSCSHRDRRPGVNFIIILQAAFALTDPKNAKRSDNSTVFIALSGFVIVKTACRMLMQLSPVLWPSDGNHWPSSNRETS